MHPVPPYAASVWLIVLLCATSSAASGAAASGAPQDAAVVRSLTACRKLAGDAARLACYDRAADDFMRAEVKGEVIVVDREQVRAVRRQAFGFHLPSLDLLPHVGGEAPVDRVTFQLASAGRTADGKWAMTTSDGAQWVQTDSDELFDPPHAGSQLTVRSGALGSFFCKVDGQLAVRCQRRR